MSSDEEVDDIMDLEKVRDEILCIPKNDRMHVSAWEDDDDGIEETMDAAGYILFCTFSFDLSTIQIYKQKHN